MPENIIPESRVHAHRARTFRTRPELALTSLEEAVEFVEERGFVHFWPIKGGSLPSLWAAVAGDRPVASAHDDPGHVTWGWKDEMLDQRRWYYAKILRGKATMIALEAAPYFYALTQNYGEPEIEYLDQYRDGLLSREARLIFEAILDEGPLDTVSLRRKLRMTGKASNSPFERGLVRLQRDFKILPVGVARTGGWRYSFIYEATHRYYPDIPEAARTIGERQARRHLLSLYFDALGAASESEAGKVFQWRRKDLRRALEALVEAGEVLAGWRWQGKDGPYFVVPELSD